MKTLKEIIEDLDLISTSGKGVDEQALKEAQKIVDTEETYKWI